MAVSSPGGKGSAARPLAIAKDQFAQNWDTIFGKKDAKPGRLVLIRGLPGSGKSTMAKIFTACGFLHYEADMFHMRGEEYCYDPANVKAGHEWCQQETLKALRSGRDVVVSNTFTRNFEMEPYFEMCRILGIVPNVLEAKGVWKNIHNVPEEVIQRMQERWEPLTLTI